MVIGEQKYVDPTEVLQTIVDEQGNFIPIGDQKDIGEFNLYFLARVEEGLKKGSGNEAIQPESQLHNPSLIEQNPNEENFERRRMKKHSLSIVQDESAISKLFFGKQLTETEYEEEGIEKNIECEDLFNMIILDVCHGDIYSSWDAANFCEIEDFKTESGKIIKAERSNSIIKLPSTLCFQLQRVAFDKEIGAFKLNNPFDFEKELFVDRFLYMYKEKYRIVREKVKSLKKEVSEVENLLNSISHYENSNCNLKDILSLTSSFIQKQKEIEGEERQGNNLTSIGNLGNTNENLGLVSSILNSYEKKINENLKEHQEKLRNLKATIEESFDEFRGSRYLLQSILMHEGSAESGHYYSYIFDFEKKSWRKFNDRIVTEEKEEAVMLNAKGNGIISAYCLIYIREDLAIKESPSPSNHESASTSFSDNSYTQLVTRNEEIYKEVSQANSAFKSQLEEFILSKDVSLMTDDYTLKLHQLNEISDRIKEKSKDKKLVPPFLLNFAIYLNTQNKVDLAKHHLLSSLIKGKLFDETLEVKFKEMLMRRILSLPLQSQTILSLPNPHEYHLFHKNYENDFICSKILLRSYEHIFSREFYVGCVLIHYILSLVLTIFISANEKFIEFQN